MIKLTLTDQDHQLMRKVCELQLKSFKKILSTSKESTIKEKLIEYHLSEKELNLMITTVAAQYRDIQLTPGALFHTHSDLLGNFREALDFNTETLADFSGQIPSMLRKLDLAIHILQSRN